MPLGAQARRYGVPLDRPARPLAVTRATALLLALLTLVLVAGCGGDREAQQVLADTFTKAQPVTSGKVDLKLQVDANGLPGVDEPLAVQLAGPFETPGGGAPSKYDLDLVLGTGAQQLKTGIVSTGDGGWLKLQGRAYTLSDEVLEQLRKSQTGPATTGKGLDLKALGVDPASWLDGAELVGTEDLGGGDRARHVRGDVDVPALLTDLSKLVGRAGSLGLAAGAAGTPRKLTEEQREQLEDSVESARLDVWSGEADKRLRRLVVEVQFDVPEKVRGEGTPEQRGTMRLDLALRDLDAVQGITAPRDARPFRELQEGLGQLAQALQGSAAAQGGQTYEQCLQAAGQDLAAQQACAPLLGG